MNQTMSTRTVSSDSRLAQAINFDTHVEYEQSNRPPMFRTTWATLLGLIFPQVVSRTLFHDVCPRLVSPGRYEVLGAKIILDMCPVVVELNCVDSACLHR